MRKLNQHTNGNRAFRFTGVLAALLMVAPGFLLANLPAPQAEPEATTAVMESNVRSALNRLAYLSIFDDLTFSIEGDKVILSGEVTRPVVRNVAQQAVSRVQGVAEVDNQIELLPLSPNDDRIRLAAANAIYGSPSLNRYLLQARPSIRIIVRNGSITLKGIVNNQLDRDLAYFRVVGIPGGFSVSNELRLDGVS